MAVQLDVYRNVSAIPFGRKKKGSGGQGNGQGDGQTSSLHFLEKGVKREKERKIGIHGKVLAERIRGFEAPHTKTGMDLIRLIT